MKRFQSLELVHDSLTRAGMRRYFTVMSLMVQLGAVNMQEETQGGSKADVRLHLLVKRTDIKYVFLPSSYTFYNMKNVSRWK